MTQSPDDIRRIADREANTIEAGFCKDPVYSAFLCLCLYGAADELERRRAWDRHAVNRSILSGESKNLPR